MNWLDMLLLYWAAPSLTAFLLLSRAYSADFNTCMSEFNERDWLLLTGLAVLYPVGMLLLIEIHFPEVRQSLLKSRNFKWWK